MNLPILSTAAQTMSSREIAELTGKRHDHVMRDIREMLVQLHGEGGIPSFGDTHTNEQNGQSYPIFRLPKRETLILVSGYSVELRARIIDRWEELERQQAARAITLPNFTDPAAAAIAWAAEYQAKQAAMLERDEAIRTKAQIGSRREATAMATAAKATREAEQLRHELGFSVRHATVMQVNARTGQEFDYVPLRRWCKQRGIKAVSVPDKRYESVKAWPADAWRDAYGIDLCALFGGAS